MSEKLITVSGVSKKFCKDLKQSLWYGVTDVGKELIGHNSDRTKLRRDEFWAVRDVNLELRRGETLGIIGHNGAGKTTLLRMLNGLIKPDLGRIEVAGRVQALIALGAGFNPLLTGRENIYINASVFGLTKSETDDLYDQIVDFSGLAEFIDMPVQSYSSGMAVRLGFSVAANLDPDILLVDEVLAVGDLAFRSKCQVRIQELRNRGVAIIFISHNLHAVSHICTRAITMDGGQMVFEGQPPEAIDIYRSLLIENRDLTMDLVQDGSGEIKITRLETLDQDGAPRETENFHTGDPAWFRIYYEASEPIQNPVVNLTIKLLNGEPVTGIRTDVDGRQVGTLAGSGYIDLRIPDLNLLPNIYSIGAVLLHADGFTIFDRLQKQLNITVIGGHNIDGVVHLPHHWDLQDEPLDIKDSIGI